MKYLRLKNYRLNEDFIDSYDEYEGDDDKNMKELVDDLNASRWREVLSDYILPFLSKYRMMYLCFMNWHGWLNFYTSSGNNTTIGSFFSHLKWSNKSYGVQTTRDSMQKIFKDLSTILDSEDGLYKNLKNVNGHNDNITEIFTSTIMGEPAKIFSGVFNYYIEILRNKVGEPDPYLKDNHIGKSYLKYFNGSKLFYSQIASYLGINKVTKDFDVKDILENFLELLVAALNKGYEDFPKILREGKKKNDENVEKWLNTHAYDKSEYKSVIMMYYSILVLMIRKVLEVFDKAGVNISLNTKFVSVDTYYKKIIDAEPFPNFYKLSFAEKTKYNKIKDELDKLKNLILNCWLNPNLISTNQYNEILGLNYENKNSENLHLFLESYLVVMRHIFDLVNKHKKGLSKEFELHKLAFTSVFCEKFSTHPRTLNATKEFEKLLAQYTIDHGIEQMTYEIYEKKFLPNSQKYKDAFVKFYNCVKENIENGNEELEEKFGKSRVEYIVKDAEKYIKPLEYYYKTKY